MTNTTDEDVDPRLDAHIRRTLREVAGTVPSAQRAAVPLHGLHGGRRPDESRQTRRRAVAVAATALALSGFAGAFVLAAGGDDRSGVGVGSSLDPMNAAPQRLFLQWWGELRPDGAPSALDMAGLDPHGSPQPLPGGRHVVAGVHPTEEPLPPDVDEDTDVTYGLAVVGPDGEVEVERAIEPSTLAGATATEAILVRGDGPVRVVAHDLETGEERVVADGLDSHYSSAEGGLNSAVVGNTLVTVESEFEGGFEGSLPGEECRLETLDLASGAVERAPLRLDCQLVWDVRPSPDGSRVAVAYETPDIPTEVRLAGVRVVDGTVVTDESLGIRMDCREPGSCPPGSRRVDFLGMAWEDDATVRVALLDAAARPDWNFDEDPPERDDLIVETHAVE